MSAYHPVLGRPRDVAARFVRHGVSSADFQRRTWPSRVSCPADCAAISREGACYAMARVGKSTRADARRGQASIRPRGFIKWPIRKSVDTKRKRYDKILASTTSKREARGMAIAGHMSRGLREGGLILLGAFAVYLLISLATFAPTNHNKTQNGTGAG